MSFLNALASDGLSVGLRYYTAKMNQRCDGGAAGSCGADQASLMADSLLGTQDVRVVDATEKAAKPQQNQTPAEMMAGRMDAQARLAGDGGLGQLQAASSRANSTGRKGEGSGAASESSAKASATEGGEQKSDSAEPASPTKELNPEEKKQLAEMQQRDREVKAHEQAHRNAGAGLAGAPSYEYAKGPDGRRYAVGGEVQIKTSGGGGGGDSSQAIEGALRDAETVKKAALAPAEPSSQDRQVASQASADISRLRAEKSAKEREELQDDKDGNENSIEDSKLGSFEINSAASITSSQKLEDSASKTNQSGQSPFGGAPIFNGSAPEQHALGAYGAAKQGFAGQSSPRPLLARM